MSQQRTKPVLIEELAKAEADRDKAEARLKRSQSETARARQQLKEAQATIEELERRARITPQPEAGSRALFGYVIAAVFFLLWLRAR